MTNPTVLRVVHPVVAIGCLVLLSTVRDSRSWWVSHNLVDSPGTLGRHPILDPLHPGPFSEEYTSEKSRDLAKQSFPGLCQLVFISPSSVDVSREIDVLDVRNPQDLRGLGFDSRSVRVVTLTRGTTTLRWDQRRGSTGAGVSGRFKVPGNGEESGDRYP